MLWKVFYYQIEFVKKLIELTVTSFGDLLLKSVSYIWSNGKLSPALLTDGLGLHAARPRNLSLLAKLNWNLSFGDNLPWAKVLKAKYMSRSFPWSSKGSCSRTWATCKAAKPLLDKGLRKVITTGTSTSFWNDTWSSLGNLRSILSGPLNYQEENSLVAQFIDDYRNWKWDNLSFVLPQSLSSIINAIPINPSSFCEDLTA